MIVIGICVGSQSRFEQQSVSASTELATPGDRVITVADMTTPAAYNTVLEAVARSHPLDDLDVVILLRDDVVISAPDLPAAALHVFDQDPHVGALGVIRHAESGVEYLDGRALVLRPELAATCRFDDVAFPDTTGFDVDFCRRIRAAGWRLGPAPTGIELPADAPDPQQPSGGVARRRDAPVRAAAAAWQGRVAHAAGLDALERIVARAAGTHHGPDRYGSTPPARGPVTDEVPLPQIVDLIPPDATEVLVLGCGSGALGRHIRAARRARVTGVDHHGDHLEAARAVLDEIVVADLNDPHGWAPPPGPFDAIVAVDILDRLLDPEATLARIVGALAPQGVVVATVPNVKHWSVTLPLLLHDRWEYRDAGLLHRGSVRFFTMVEALAMLRRLHLSRIEIAGADRVALHDPTYLDPLVGCLETYGADADEVRMMLEVFTYVVTARRT